MIDPTLEIQEFNKDDLIGKVPREFLEIYNILSNFDIEGSENWKPELIEVYIWPYEYAPDDPPVEWPKDWPDCNHPTSYKSGDSYSIYIDSTKSEEINKIISKRRQKQAIGISGKKWAISRRDPMPSEKFWMSRTPKPDDVHPVLVFINPDPWAMVIGSDGPVFLLLENGRIYYQSKQGMKTKKFDILPETTIEDLLSTIFTSDSLPIFNGFLNLIQDYYSIIQATDQPCPCIKYWYKSGKISDTSSTWKLKSVSVYGLSNNILVNPPQQKNSRNERCIIS